MERSDTPTKHIDLTKTADSGVERENRLLSEMVTIRQSYNQSLFELKTLKNNMQLLEDENKLLRGQANGIWHTIIMLA